MPNDEETQGIRETKTSGLRLGKKGEREGGGEGSIPPSAPSSQASAKTETASKTATGSAWARTPSCCSGSSGDYPVAPTSGSSPCPSPSPSRAAGAPTRFPSPGPASPARSVPGGGHTPACRSRRNLHTRIHTHPSARSSCPDHGLDGLRAGQGTPPHALPERQRCPLRRGGLLSCACCDSCSGRGSGCGGRGGCLGFGRGAPSLRSCCVYTSSFSTSFLLLPFSLCLDVLLVGLVSCGV